ncbi:MAG: apolipoprotein N-acyltransferase [Bifidobacteriaceae bacterium]|jgi:apolipoprotein N-acyltransferase|nr:apolipoprotein N-acyltransferase [Bifidobacteriaceae bacterium]
MPPRRFPWVSLIAAVAAGLVSYSAFTPAGWWLATPAAAAALYLVLRSAGPWRGFGLAAAFGLAQFLPMLTWAYKAAGWLPYLALSVTSAGLLALAAVVYGYARWLVPGFRGAGRGRRAGRRGNAAGAASRTAGGAGWTSASVADAVLFALALTAADGWRQFFPFGGFPWGRLGFTQVGGPMARWAWLGGVSLVGLAAVLAGCLAVVLAAALVGVARRRDTGSAGGTGQPGAGRPGRRPSWAGNSWRGLGLAAGGVALTVAGPLLAPISAAAEGGTLMVGAVQGDVEVSAEGLFTRQREVLENHVEVSLELASSVGAGALDVVLWPENSTDIDPRVDDSAYAAIDQAAAALDAPVLVGAMQYVGRANRYNQGLLWRPGLGVVDIYSKRHPAPFAEYMPARSFFRVFTDKVDLIDTDMLAGETIGVMPFDAAVLGREVALGDIICFEVAYDAIVGDVVRAGAEFVVVQTNNASFGFSQEATQQFAMTRLRAIEHGRATVQISTVGVSAAVAPDGSLLTPLTSLFEPAFFTASLPLRTSTTPATRIGGAVGWALMIAPLALAVAGLGARLGRRRSR